MTFNFSRRNVVRIISFAAAIAIVLGVFVVYYARDAAKSKRALEYHYLKSVEDLTTYSQNIAADLSKAMYANSPAMLNKLSSKLWRESGFAKESLDDLPIDYSKLANTNKLLSQVGNYCVSLSNGFAKGQNITNEQREILQQLNEYCGAMANEVALVNDSIRVGALTLDKVDTNINKNFDKMRDSGELADGFADLEQGFTSYPTLIYDGPFSDHIMQKEPQRLKHEHNIAKEDAKKAAAIACGVSVDALADGTDEVSKMESYGFVGEGVEVSITKRGGLISYMLKSREVGESKLSVDDALVKARHYMDNLSIPPMALTYYEVSNNIVTINYAYKQGDAVVYTDLIKVSVALDNGEVTGFDARGYIVNHWERPPFLPRYSIDTAAENVSDFLDIEKWRLCLIPDAGLNETLCYEFKCKSKEENPKDILVYINADTLAEEQILILLIGENGTLTI